MKVLQINSHYNRGGAGKIVACLHNALLDYGHESSVIYGRGVTVDEPHIYRIGSSFSNLMDVLTTRVVGINGFESRSATKQAVSIIEKESPDILHLHGLHGYYLNYAILFAYINAVKIPCVWTFHDCLAFTGKCGYPYDCEKFVHGCEYCQHLKDYPTSYGFDFTRWMWTKKKDLFTATDNKIIVSPSDWMTEMAKKSFFCKYNCTTIHNGIDTKGVFYLRDKAACRQKLNIGAELKVALGIAFGLDDPRKGVGFILQAANDMPDVTFILIGWSKKKDYLLAGLNNVTSLPFTSNQEELALYYSAADVFLLPSLAENYATTAIESLACGTPIVGFNVGGIPEQASGICGITVECGNQELFNKAIRDYVGRGQSQEKDRAIISQKVQTENSVGTMLDRYMNLYTSIF